MVTWTARARADLKAIHDYIAKDSSINAKRVVREMHRKAAGLAETPLIGRVVLELEDPDIREIPAYYWRLIYQLREQRVFVITVIHKRRQPSAGDIVA
jgi:toxin ParE1/3/4